jgi:hypothetical protein
MTPTIAKRIEMTGLSNRSVLETVTTTPGAKKTPFITSAKYLSKPLNYVCQKSQSENITTKRETQKTTNACFQD